MRRRIGTATDGFSMLEIIVALAVVALAIAIAFPMFNSAPQNLGADLQDFTLNLQVARELGVSRTVHYRINADTGTEYLMQWCDPTQVDCTVASSWNTERTIELRPNMSFSNTPTPAIAEFDTRGFLVLQTGQAAPLVFTLTDGARNWSKNATVNTAGMVDTQ